MLVYSTIDWELPEKHFHPDCVDYRDRHCDHCLRVLSRLAPVTGSAGSHYFCFNRHSGDTQDNRPSAGHPQHYCSGIVIMGMGINYSIYYACFYQRYRDENHPAMDIVRLANVSGIFYHAHWFRCIGDCQAPIFCAVSASPLS